MSAVSYSAALEAARTLAASNDQTPPPVTAIVEALLFAGTQPLSAEAACGVVRGLTTEAFRDSLQDLAQRYRQQHRPYAIQETATGYQIALKTRFRSIRERLVAGPREARLSMSALDVLAIVAYRQPIAKSALDALRGEESSSILRQLVRLGLIAIESTDAETKESTYGTTPRFLEVFGLKSLDELPQTMDLQKI